MRNQIAMMIMLLLLFTASAKAFRIHGIVNDYETKEPLIGVAIMAVCYSVTRAAVTK